MENNRYNNTQGIKITIKGIVRALSIICIALTFCPAFFVSCSGQEISISATHAAVGIKMYGNKVSSAHPLLLLTLLIPVVIFCLFFVKRIQKKTLAIIIFACSVVDFIIWLLFRSAVKSAAEENYCNFKGAFGFYLSVVSIIMIIALSLVVVFTRFSFKSDLIAQLSKEDIAVNAMSQMSMAVSRASNKVSRVAADISANTAERSKNMTQNRQGICQKCGAVVKSGNQFCIKCGSPVSMPNNEDIYDETPLFCPNCGNKLEHDSVFCASCGYRLDTL